MPFMEILISDLQINIFIQIINAIFRNLVFLNDIYTTSRKKRFWLGNKDSERGNKDSDSENQFPDSEINILFQNINARFKNLSFPKRLCPKSELAAPSAKWTRESRPALQCW
jgi:hypothetical protein